MFKLQYFTWSLNLTKGRSKVGLKFFKYSNSKDYLVTPDVVDYEKTNMTKPVYDVILGCKTMKELGIVLHFQTNEITLMKSSCQ